ncbi:MAG: hypothetical protein ABFR36_05990 [Acidobacteriota bacterium]
MKKLILLLTAALIIAIPSMAKGNFEIGFHYSVWNVNMIAPLLEDEIIPEIEYWDPEYGSLSFSSNGSNYGFEFRFFPGGKDGSFSMGLSYERNNFKMRADGTYDGKDDHGNPIKAEASGTIDLLPHSINLSIRWELWPTKRIHPFIGFGFGFGAQEALVKFHSRATTTIGGIDVVEEQDEVWNFDDIEAEYEASEGKKFPVSFFPVIHINFGFRGEVVDNVYLLGEVAFYNGLIFRGGIAYRF